VDVKVAKAGRQMFGVEAAVLVQGSRPTSESVRALIVTCQASGYLGTYVFLSARRSITTSEDGYCANRRAIVLSLVEFIEFLLTTEML
jgi:hypothetical protein